MWKYTVKEIKDLIASEPNVVEVELYRYNDYRVRRQHGDFVFSLDEGLSDFADDDVLECDVEFFDKEAYGHFIANSCISVDDFWNKDEDKICMIFLAHGQKIPEYTPERALGFEIAAKRNEKGLTQQQLAEICGIKQSNLSCIERGIGNVTYKTLNRIAEALGAELKIELK
jgi:DNA-binding XRE family transcriptional regulator